MGIFSGSGVGKSTLLGMMTRFTAADVIVVAPARELACFLWAAATIEPSTSCSRTATSFTSCKIRTASSGIRSRK